MTDAALGQAVTKQSIAALSAQRLLDRLAAVGVSRELTAIAFGNRYDIVPLKKRPLERQRVCNLDVETIVPRAKLSSEVAKNASATIGAIQPRGMTPISQSLTLASDNLGPEGGSIVLITDWEDPCGASDLPPCTALEQIGKSRRGRNQGRVTLQVILVPRSRNFDPRYVNGLRDCTGAQIFYLTTPDEVEKTVAALIPPPPIAPVAPSPTIPPPPKAAPLARIRIIQLTQRANTQGSSSPIIVQILDLSDRVVSKTALNNETDELTAPAGNYKAKALFPDGREITLPLDGLEPGSERVIYVSR
jgi:hypothetical protein